MFKSLVRNIAITGVAYLIVSTIGLLLAPFLIAAYGLAGYGQILLARLFLPTATLGFLDFGLGETATRTVASARRDTNWVHASSTLTLLLVMTLVISALTGAVLALCAPSLPTWFSIPDGEQSRFTDVMLVTAACQPLLFLSLVFEGVLKGFERFKTVRSCEVASALIYGASSLIAVAIGWSAHWIAVALLLGLTIRALMAGTAAIFALRAANVRLMRWSIPARREVLAWSRLMFVNKVLGTAQTQTAPPLIGLILGPAAVGAFDAVVRLPRFAKAVMGLFNTTVLPVAAGLKAVSDSANLKKLGQYGTMGAWLLSLPPLIFAIAYSRSLLHHWIGGEVTQFWAWQSIMFLIPCFSVVIGFGGTILLADRAASAALNRLTSFQVALQIMLSLALVGMLEQWSFILGHVISAAVVFPFQFALISRTLGLDKRLPRLLTTLVSTAGILTWAVRAVAPEPDLPLLLLIGMTLSAGMWAISPWLLMAPVERAWLRARLISLLGGQYFAGKRS